MATPPPSNTDAITINNTIILNVSMTNVTKLTATSYMMWNIQVHYLLDGYDLVGHLDGSTAVLPATVTSDNVVSVNPDFKIWKRQEKLIFSVIIGAISSPLQPLVSRCTTVADAWATLANTFAKPSRGHIKQLKTQLKQWKKGNRNIDEYFQGLTTRFDQLAILCKALDHEDQVEIVLEGLPDEYKHVIAQIEGKDATPSITEVHERLLNHEAKLMSSVVEPSFPAYANVAQQRPVSNNNNNARQQPRNHNGSNNNGWQPQLFYGNNNQRSNRPYQGRCQMCNVQGHRAKRCPHLLPLTSAAPSQLSTGEPFHTMAASCQSQCWSSIHL